MSKKREIFRAPLFTIYFFLLVSAYYFLKPLSRSLYITHLGANNLPYVWIATTLVLSIIIPLFHLKISKVQPLHLILSLVLSLTILLTLFRYILDSPSIYSAFTFYILVDVYSVLIIENFWSLINSSYPPDVGKRWYGLIASGGLSGGVFGGWAGSHLIEHWNFRPLDLIDVSNVFFILSLPLIMFLFKKDYTAQPSAEEKPESAKFTEIYSNILKSPYVRWVACLLFAAQLIEPLVEYQFMSFVELNVASLAHRTQYVSEIFAYTSCFGILVNLAIVPLLHYFGGVSGGLLLQPILISAGSAAFLFLQSLTSISVLKIIDRGLAYSSGRASRELLYIPFERTAIYKIKAWIDVYGYRFFRIFGSLLLIIVTKWIPVFNPVITSGIMVLIISFLWLSFVINIKKSFKFT
jgi:AAA family ATP:ADP antiporter